MATRQQDSPLEFCDISFWNGDFNFNTLASPPPNDRNIRGVIARAIYNRSIDTQFERNWVEAKKAGLMRGLYAYLLWGYDIIAQASALVTEMNLLDPDPTTAWGELPPVADAEDTAGVNTPVAGFVARLTLGYKKETGERVAPKVPVNPVTRAILKADFKAAEARLMREARASAFASATLTTPAQKLQKWLDIIEPACGHVPMIYTSAGWWNTYIGNQSQFRRYPLWIAHYNRQSPLTPLPWQPMGWTFWQTGSTYNGLYFGNSTGNNYIDLNVFWGGEAELQKITTP